MEFWRFKPVDITKYTEVYGDYNYTLVFLSVFVSALAAYSALIILERVWSSSNKKVITLWVWFGATTFGLGVWAMHFTGMLAFMVPVPMHFDPLITLISALPPILGALFAIRILALRLFSFWWVQVGSLALALGIGTMHFIGMEAMTMNAKMHYNFPLFLSSIIVAHFLATIALYTRVFLKSDESSYYFPRIISALFMGCAVAGMHYTAMASVKYYTLDASIIGQGMTTSDNIILAGVIILIVAVFVGITVIGIILDKRLEHAENSAKVSETRERAVVETLADGLLVIDVNGTIDALNQSAARIFHQDIGSAVGAQIETFMPTITYEKLLHDSGQTNPSLIGKTIELEGVKTDGKIFPLEATFSKMQLGARLMFNTVIRDITERRQLEEKLRQSQKLKSIGQLAAGMAHEINTPTQYISDNTIFLKDVFDDVITALIKLQKLVATSGNEFNSQQIEQTKQALEDADIEFIADEVPKAISQSLDGLKRVAVIVNAMKSFSHPSDENKQLINIHEAIETTVTVASSEWKYVTDVDYNFSPDLPLVPCLRDELNQAILNIIVNAAHAITDTLNADKGREKGLITISTAHNDQFATIIITDDGPGMPEHVRERIFDPFFTTKEVGKGTGQGLSIAYSVIVDKHKGKISVSSQQGKGTTFTISLPLEENETANVAGTV